VGAPVRHQAAALSAPADHADLAGLGRDDKLLSVQNAEIWRQYIPKAELQTFKAPVILVLTKDREAVDAVQRFLS